MSKLALKRQVQEGTRIIGEVRIGERCIIAPNVFLSSGSHHFSVKPAMPIRDQDRLVWSEADHAHRQSRPIELHDDCWLGINVVIMPGVTVGRGAVIGANSVVTSDVPPYCVVAGSPARPIGQRLKFDPPAALTATNAADLPYFYQGFPLTVEGAKNQLQCSGGLEATGRFVLALGTGDGHFPSRIRLWVSYPGDVKAFLQFGRQKVKLPQDIEKLDFNIFQKSGPLYIFKSATAEGKPARIVLKKACLIIDEPHDK